MTILCSFSCICRLSWACILGETSTKATRNVYLFLTVLPRCLLLLTVLPLDSVVDCSLWVPLSTYTLSSLGPPSLRPILVSRGISTSSPLFGFRAKSKKFSAWRTTHIVSHRYHKIVDYISLSIHLLFNPLALFFFWRRD